MSMRFMGLFLSAILLSGCHEVGIYTQRDIDVRDGKIASLKSSIEALQSANEDLRSNIDRLQSENWRDVVPDIEQSADEVETAQNEANDAAAEPLPEPDNF